jgi:hypothetical protein
LGFVFLPWVYDPLWLFRRTLYVFHGCQILAAFIIE